MHRPLRLAVTVLLGAVALATSAAAQPADLILRGGRIVTVDGNWRIAEAVAIRDGRFVAVGDNAAVAPLAGPSTQIIELGGRTVVPGLIDTHLHQMFAALNSPAVQLLSSRSIADVQKAIAARVAADAAGAMGHGVVGLAREHPRGRPHADPLRARPGVAEQSGVHPARRPRRHGEQQGARARRHHQGHAQPARRRDRARSRDRRGDRHAAAERRQSRAPHPPAAAAAGRHRRACSRARCASSTRSASSAWSSPASTSARSRSIAKCTTPAR